MFKNLTKLNNLIQSLHNSVEYDIEPYRKVLGEINEIKLDSSSDNELKEMSMELKNRACTGDTSEKLLVEAFALVREASRRVLGLYPFSTKTSERYLTLCRRLGEKVLQKVEKQITLYYISKCWAEYLDYIADVREGIHLVVFGGKDPLDEFLKSAIEAFDEMVDRIDGDIIRTFNVVEINEDGIDMDKEGLNGPSSTWTYLMNDNPDQFSKFQLWFKAAATAFSKPLFTVQSIYRLVFGK